MKAGLKGLMSPTMTTVSSRVTSTTSTRFLVSVRYLEGFFSNTICESAFSAETPMTRSMKS